MSATTSSGASHAGEHEPGHEQDREQGHDPGDGHGHPSHCENCDAPLQGHYCHVCGQSIVNPIRHAGHALEEVFESFWHLDGRIFRTLRDLLSPGRVAKNYIAGHRVRYVAPLRLFVIVSVLTFFVAQFTVHFDEAKSDGFEIIDLQGTTVRMGNRQKQIKKADSVAEVESLRLQTVKELQAARAAIPASARGAIDKSIEGVQRQADLRIETLRGEQSLDETDIAEGKAEGAREAAEALVPPNSIAAAKTLAEVEQRRDALIAPLKAQLATAPAGSKARDKTHREIAKTNAEAGCRIAALQIAHATTSQGARPRPLDAQRYGDTDCDDDSPLSFNGRAWDAKTNPLTVSWWPQFANDWLNRQVGRGEVNFKRASKEPWLYIHSLIAAVPSALFLMVPIFALLLKLTYLGSGRGYLEHLAVALYSHVYLCLSILAMFVLVLLSNAISPHWSGFAWISGLGISALWIWMPIYLLLMEKRVYGNGWLLTLARYTVIGTLYFVLLSFAVTALAFAALVRM
ncbi:hypothetical protein AZ78_3597 [Lysobacter capsici AZ78]|uniref:DUF3667 domain-containing protein n=1 Tax=Lysobacter capsici AZ78 TaxID=1444315 RepID=A0A108UBE6_9GAMM|nr:DUF3667 domain-containing protein [Lysobacter capsici]KWS06043.1 hypothetical protein AZ78_3597 [Lysobacter capsici AZ78]